MDISLDVDALRKKHKAELVEKALSIFGPGAESGQVKDYWLEKMLAGHDINQMLDCLKQGHATLAEEVPDVGAQEEESPLGKLDVIDDNLTLHAGLKRKLLISLKNNTDLPFETTPEKPVFVAYHWYHANGDVYEFDGVRTALEDPIVPGHTAELRINLTPPAEPGDYQLMVTMVHEGRCWMEEIGLDVQRLGCTVQDYDGRGLSRHALSVFKQLQAAEQEVRV